MQPGVVLARLNEHLRPFGRLFGPDPAMAHVTTMGSVIAIDASGSHWLRYGSARRHVVSLQVVLSDGSVMEVGRERRIALEGEVEQPRKRRLINEVALLIERNAELIRRRRPAALVNQCGYQLDDVITSEHVEFGRLLCGAEGTLAIVTEATVAIQPLPRHEAVGLLYFDSLDRATQAVQEILPFGPSACDLLDRRHLSLAREADVRYDVMLPNETEALLLVEHAGEDAGAVQDALTRTLEHVRRKKRLAFDEHFAFEAEDRELCWNLVRKVTPTLHRLKGSARPLPFVEDVAVPPGVLPAFVMRLQNTLKRHQVTASLYGHVGHGQLHVRPFLDLTSAADVKKLDELAADIYQETFAMGGTISGEHGDGLSRTPFVRQQYGELYEVFRELKQTFDPSGILNPGKIVSDDLSSLSQHLRPLGSIEEVPSVAPSANGDSTAASTFELQLNWTLPELMETARSCNGCGACRSQLGDVRMCPIFRVTPGEEASPRAKANLVRALAGGDLDRELLGADELKEIADLCVNCHQCRLECPAGVDIPKLMIETKAQYIARNGVPPSDLWRSRLDVVGRWGSVMYPAANWMIKNRQARWLLEKMVGLARRGSCPGLPLSRLFAGLIARS